MVGRTLGMFLCLLLAAACLPTAALAQADGGVVVRSAPPGAVVELVGQHVFRGVTPWRLDRGLSGTYEVRAYKAGYEEWGGYILLSSGRRDSLYIRLSRKTPLGAGLRSGIVPGWGQFYTDQPVKGALFFVAEAAAISMVAWTNGKREDAKSDYSEAREAYLEADHVDEMDARFDEMSEAFDDLERWHERRKRWSYAALLIWVANVVDASVLFPSPSAGGGYSTLPDGDDSGFFASIEQDRTTAGVVIRF